MTGMSIPLIRRHWNGFSFGNSLNPEIIGGNDEKLLIIIFSIFLLSIGVYFLVKFNDDEVVKIRFERHGAHGDEIMLMVSESGKLDTYVSHSKIGSDDVDKWTQADATHKETTITLDQLKEIKKIANEVFWQQWFFYDGHIIWDDIEGYWYRIVNIQGKEYDFYNYPYSENGLNQLVEMVVKLSPIEIELDNKGNVISVGGVVQ